MRADQLEKLSALSERLTDVFLDESDPDGWAGSEKRAAELNKQERGDRYWCKKNAASTLALVMNVEKLKINDKVALGRDPYDDGELDGQIARAEAQARQLMNRLNDPTRKAEFDKHVHGKP